MQHFQRAGSDTGSYTLLAAPSFVRALLAMRAHRWLGVATTAALILVGTSCAGRLRRVAAASCPDGSADPITTSYNRFRDSTTITTPTLYFGWALPVPELQGICVRELRLTALAQHGGQTLRQTPVAVDLLLTSNAAQRHPSAEAIALLDGATRIRLPVVGSEQLPAAYQALLSIPTSVFARLVTARTLELEFSGSQVTFTESQLRVLREFSRRLQPS